MWYFRMTTEIYYCCNIMFVSKASFIRFDPYSGAMLVPFFGSKRCCKEAPDKTHKWGINVINVRFKPKMHYRISHRATAANFEIIKMKILGISPNTCHRFAYPMFCQQINRSKSLFSNHTPPQQSFSARVLPERKGNVENWYRVAFLRTFSNNYIFKCCFKWCCEYCVTQNNLFDSFIQNEIHPACCLHPWDGCLCPCEETNHFYNISPFYFSLIYILALHTVNIWQNSHAAVLELSINFYNR